jgi:hypothetical protein
MATQSAVAGQLAGQRACADSRGAQKWTGLNETDRSQRPNRKASSTLMTAFAARTALDEAVTDEAGVDFRASAGGACHSAACSTWPGIPAHEIDRVFDVAFRGSPARTPERLRNQPAGAGLGLAIARGLVEAHHGRIGARNYGPGCRFEVRLPLAPTG